MAPERVAAICDACTLYPFHQRNILVQASVDGLYEARWTDEIHDEWTRNLLANAPAIPPGRLQIARQLMETVLPGARVANFHHHIDKLSLPDPGDRHVLAAAIEAKASLILTWNLRDFPATTLKRHGLMRQTPDAFLTGLYGQAPQLVVASLANARRNLSKSGVSAQGFLDLLKNQKLFRLEKHLQGHLDDL
ncbi:PIN domain-containing protein [Vineibacter terrae]|uniref:PIN domain-containing protein n=1 Tax=Vineibacter terrae TaxID=2586908 RepID=A0A5C8PC53_9HYPH|nr:PIN domain-containing protein [Vineibacter terrae]TXL70958.1 PIN domain-containing protein [Vineibacter terrae]